MSGMNDGERLEMQPMADQTQKFDAGKPPMGLLSTTALTKIAEVMAFGRADWPAHGPGIHDGDRRSGTPCVAHEGFPAAGEGRRRAEDSPSRLAPHLRHLHVSRRRSCEGGLGAVRP